MYESLMKIIFSCSYPKYTSYQFMEMLNVGLVLIGIKPGALVKLDNSAINALHNSGFYVQPYPLLKGFTFVSIKKLHFKDTLTHTDVGKALGYLTPINIDDNVDNAKQNKKFVKIQVTFKRLGSKPLIANIMSQVVINKTIHQIEKYLHPFINGIYKLHIPSQFKILSIQTIIE
jgi:hypothetical protein